MMRIAFLVGRFPSLSETFILNQITGLIDRGHDVQIYARKPGDGDKVHPDVDKYRLRERVTYRAMPSNAALRTLKGIGVAVGGVAQKPGGEAGGAERGPHGGEGGAAELKGLGGGV